MKTLIFLIGYRGSGKTTVGMRLAALLGWSFIDADLVLEARWGRTIAAVFKEEGEKSFRDKESIILAELCQRENCVIGTGGGVIMRDENRDRLKQSGFIVWLKANVQTLAERVAADTANLNRRPVLSIGGLEEIENMLTIREPYYRALANMEIDSSQRSPELLAEAILKEWNSNFNSPKSSG